jgi:uncharacterized Ntn-hydrolase superfamily protein
MFIGLLTLHLISTEPATPRFATFSILGRDPQTGELGVAVQSCIPAVGAVVPSGAWDAGVVASQAYANPQFGPAALDLLRAGVAPDQAIQRILEKDPLVNDRQLIVLDSEGRTAGFSGTKCMSYAGILKGKEGIVAGNILAGESVVREMVRAFEATSGRLEDRLIAALAAGQEAGGDKRGKQSAALLIVRKGWGYGGYTDRYRDIRVDDHPEPIKELQRVLGKHNAVFGAQTGTREK